MYQLTCLSLGTKIFTYVDQDGNYDHNSINMTTHKGQAYVSLNSQIQCYDYTYWPSSGNLDDKYLMYISISSNMSDENKSYTIGTGL